MVGTEGPTVQVRVRKRPTLLRQGSMSHPTEKGHLPYPHADGLSLGWNIVPHLRHNESFFRFKPDQTELQHLSILAGASPEALGSSR